MTRDMVLLLSGERPVSRPSVLEGSCLQKHMSLLESAHLRDYLNDSFGPSEVLSLNRVRAIGGTYIHLFCLLLIIFHLSVGFNRTDLYRNQASLGSDGA